MGLVVCESNLTQ